MKIKNGFTLIETMSVLSMFLLIVLLVGSLYVLSIKIYTLGVIRGELVQNVRVNLDRMSREIRQASELITNISTSTPSNDIFFQDGHNNSEIVYIKYYLNGTDLMRSQLAYYFDIDPSTYVYYGSTDLSGPLRELIINDRIVGEHFESLEFLNNEGMISMNMNLEKYNTNLNISTKAYIRNW